MELKEMMHDGHVGLHRTQIDNQSQKMPALRYGTAVTPSDSDFLCAQGFKQATAEPACDMSLSFGVIS